MWFFYHIIGASSSYGFSTSYLKFIDCLGYSGVDIFFVLSGFFMTYIQTIKNNTPKSFIADRIIRIVPLYWLLTVLVWALAVIAPNLFNSDISNITAHSIASILFISQPILSKMPVLYDGWTLEYEFLFYIIVSIGLFFSKKYLTYLWEIAAISFFIVFLGINTIAFEFILGIILGVIFFQSNKNFIFPRSILFIGLILLSLSIFDQLGPKVILDQRVILFGIPFSFIIYGLIGMPQIKSGILTMLGDASYSIYLIQVFTIPLFYRSIGSLDMPHINISDALALICAFVTVIIGVVTYLLFEKPLNYLIKEKFLF